jgi:hypothetical protein
MYVTHQVADAGHQVVFKYATEVISGVEAPDLILGILSSSENTRSNFASRVSQQPLLTTRFT